MRDAGLRILLIEDNAADVRLLREMFSKEPAGSFDITHVMRMSEGVSHLAKGETDIVLVDMGLPDEHGLATLRRAKAAAPGIPVIVLTGLDDERLAADSLQAGAEDYLVKGQIESRALPRAVRHAIERRRLQAEADLIQTHQLQLKEEFLSHVSHELRSPLTAIYLFVTILLDGLSGEVNLQQHENLAIVLKNVKQLQAMIDDLLELSRIQTGQLLVELQTTSVTDALAYAIHTLAGAAAVKGVALSSNLDCRLPLVHADPIRIRQVLIALIDNAIKFTPAEGSVDVHASVKEETPGVVTMEVSDSGAGIRPEMTEEIFGRRFQADPAIEGRRGLGLGLYICKELVTRQGGQVWARNLPEKGAVFTVTLPVVDLPSLIARFLTDDASPADSLAVISVESGPEQGWPSDDARAQWSLDSRALIQKCLLRTSDRLVPQTDSGGATEISFVVAFGNDTGLTVLEKRIRDRLTQLDLVQELGLTISVSYQCVLPAPSDSAVSSDTSPRTTAARIAAFINANHQTRYIRQ